MPWSLSQPIQTCHNFVINFICCRFYLLIDSIFRFGHLTIANPRIACSLKYRLSSTINKNDTLRIDSKFGNLLRILITQLFRFPLFFDPQSIFILYTGLCVILLFIILIILITLIIITIRQVLVPNPIDIDNSLICTWITYLTRRLASIFVIIVMGE